MKDAHFWLGFVVILALAVYFIAIPNYHECRTQFSNFYCLTH